MAVPALDFSSDFNILSEDGFLESLTYYSKASEGGVFGNGTTVDNVMWEELSQRDYAIRPDLLQQQARSVHCWTSQLGGITPKLRDKIIDSGGLVWYVDWVYKLDLDANGIQRYRLICKLQV